MPWGIAIGAAVGLAGSAMQAGAASDAANAQASASENAQAISQQEFNTITAQNAPYMQSGYGALSALDYGLGITPQTATGGNPNAAPINGYDPSSGYQISPYGGVSQFIPGGGMGGLGGSRIPISNQPAQGSPKTGGLGFGSLTKPFDASDWQKLSPASTFPLQQGR